MYTVIEVFRDLTDKHLYAPGDAFPHDGRSIDPARLHALETPENGAGKPLIVRVELPEEHTAKATARRKKA